MKLVRIGDFIINLDNVCSIVRTPPDRELEINFVDGSLILLDEERAAALMHAIETLGCYQAG